MYISTNPIFFTILNSNNCLLQTPIFYDDYQNKQIKYENSRTKKPNMKANDSNNMRHKLIVSLDQLSYLPIITKVELPLRQRILSYFSSINLHILDLVPERRTEQLLKSQLHHKFRKASLFLIEVCQELLNTGSAACLIKGIHSVVVFY